MLIAITDEVISKIEEILERPVTEQERKLYNLAYICGVERALCMTKDSQDIENTYAINYLKKKFPDLLYKK
jgi:hypothetical protein